MRFRALSRISSMKFPSLKKTLSGSATFTKKTEFEREQLLDYWRTWLRSPVAPVSSAPSLSSEERREFIIKDNVGFGEWDTDALSDEWSDIDFDEWGLDGLWENEEEKTITETEKLSELKYTGMDDEPKSPPSNFSLFDCVDTEKYEAKLAVIEESSLSAEQKEIMKMFAYRFLKINFEAVANYYAFNATEEEQKVIERLRMVLVDGSVDGFIEDDLLRIREDVMNTDLDWQTQKISGYDQT